MKSKKRSSDFDNVYFNNQDEVIEILPALKYISKIVFPNMFFFIGFYLQQTFNLIFIGHHYSEKVQKDAIDAVGISHLYVNCTLLSIVIGIISGFDTLGSNAYGAKRYYLFGLYFQRSILIGFSITGILFIFHYIFAVRFITWMGIDEDVLVFLRMYIKIMMFFVIFDVQYSINFRYFNIIGKSHVNLIILCASVILHPCWCYLFIKILNLGVRGAAISLILSQMFNAGAGLYYLIVFKPVPESIFPFNKDSLVGWGEYLKIALPSAFLGCAEWLAFEVTSVIAIWIGKLDYTVHILITNLGLNIFTISFGFGISACIIVGNSITKKSVYYVKSYSKVIFCYGWVVLSLVLIIIYSIRKKILYIFIDDIEVIEKGQEVIFLLCLQKLADISQGIFAGIFRGLGKQGIASKIAFVNFYITQIFFAVLLGKWMGLGVYGLWMALVIGSSSNALAYFYILNNFDLNKIREEIILRLEKDTSLLNNEQETEMSVNKEYDLQVTVSDKYFY
jgi:multidrug resistance protein, MATE family